MTDFIKEAIRSALDGSKEASAYVSELLVNSTGDVISTLSEMIKETTPSTEVMTVATVTEAEVGRIAVQMGATPENIARLISSGYTASWDIHRLKEYMDNIHNRY